MSLETKIPTIEEMRAEALKFADSISNLQEKQKFVNELRGITIEFSIIIEQCFNQFITSTGKELVIDPQNKTFDLIAGIRDKRDIPKIKTKKEDMKKLIKLSFQNIGEEGLQIFSDDLERFWAIRDIFAHVPINWKSPDLEFISERPYKHFFELNTNWKNVMVASIEFTGLFEKILSIMMHYHQHTLIKKEIYSKILLGKSQAEIQEEAKKLREKDEAAK